jgi:hypothetical protein
LHTVTVETTVDVVAGTVYSEAFVVAEGFDCPRVL